MGMRATIAYINKDNRVRLTTVQWSTVLDKTLGHMIAQEQDAGGDATHLVSDAFKTITSTFEHVSCVDIVEEGENIQIPTTPLAYDVFIFGGQAIGAYDVSTIGGQSISMKNEWDLGEIDIYGYHLDGNSLGAVYNENKPETIQFFWANREMDEIKTRNCGIDALGKFYGNPNNKKKLKTLGSLRKH